MNTHYTYIGPYLRCESRLVPFTQSIMACTNTTCSRYGVVLRAPYCPACGTERKNHTRDVTVDAVDRWRLSEHINEALSMPTGDTYEVEAPDIPIHFWIPNRQGVGTDYSCHDEIRIARITAERIASEATEFNTQYADVLPALYEAYGRDKVQLLWGVVHYYA